MRDFETFYKDEKGKSHRRNGGWCDVDNGPCSCGAWHNVDEIKPEQLLHPLEEIERLRKKISELSNKNWDWR